MIDAFSVPDTVRSPQPTPVKRARTTREAKAVYPMRVYATEDPRAYECSSETAPDTRYLVELDLECCSCRHWVARLLAAPIGDPSRVCKHIAHVRDTRLGDVIPLTVMPSGDDALPYEPGPLVDTADESDSPEAGLTTADGYVIAAGFPLCASCGTRRVGEVGSACDVCVAAELCV